MASTCPQETTIYDLLACMTKCVCTIIDISVCVPSCIQGDHSDSKRTGPKTCNPVKCGWICKLCHVVDAKKDVVLSRPCVHSDGHTLVESPLMCNKCFALAGDVDVLKSVPCPRALDFNEPPKKEVDERREDKSWVTWTDWEKEKKEWEQKKKLNHEMNEIKRELKRLQLLKTLQVERERMAELIAQKRNGTSVLSKHAMFNSATK